ncbi:MAG: hypothetical protein ACOC8Y_00450 [Candidatus Natronoplasma sp.]
MAPQDLTDIDNLNQKIVILTEELSDSSENLSALREDNKDLEEDKTTLENRIDELEDQRLLLSMAIVLMIGVISLLAYLWVQQRDN